AAPLLLVVTNTNDTGTGSLRDALTQANASPTFDTITFSPAVFSTPQTVALAGALPTITGQLTITGPGASLVRVQPAAGRNIRVFASTATILNSSGITVAGGNIAGNGGALNEGGTGANVTLDSVVFTGNTASGNGGAVFVGPGNFLTVRNSTITGNTAAK